MPIDPAPYPRPASSEPACRAVVAARLNAPTPRHRCCGACACGRCSAGCSTIRSCIAAAAQDVGLDPAELDAWQKRAAVVEALGADIAAARRPCAAARALDHKLGGPATQRRYTAPSYEIARPDGR